MKIVVLLLASLLSGALSFAQLQEQLQDQLVKHSLVLRNFYTGQKLKYDATGTLISTADSGIGPTDGRVYVEAVQLQAKRLLVRGERPITVFNPATAEVSLLGLHQKVEIDAELPSDRPTKEAVTEILHRIFLTSVETNAFACSADEERTFRERMLQFKEFTNATTDNKPNNQEPRQICFPAGSRAFLAGNGVVLPKAIKEPDPIYPPSELGRYDNKLVVLALIVDSKGKPRSMVVVGGSATAFDVSAINAAEQWRFEPATYQGKPVAAAINVEVDFRTH